MIVQAFLSSQPAELFVYVHPVAGLHASVVHGLLSLQVIVDPLQFPLEHESPVVHALLSLQEPDLGCVAQLPPEHTPVLHPADR